MTSLPFARALAVLLAPLPASAATVVDFADFGDCSTLQLNHDAACVDDALRLTPALADRDGSAFPRVPIALGANAAFSTAFSFRLHEGGGPFTDDSGTGADGFVFVLQPLAATSIGNANAGGGGLGYRGIADSLGIEFDTFALSTTITEPNGNHLGVDVGGSLASLRTVTIDEAPMNDGEVWYAWIDYDGATLEVRLSRTAERPAGRRLSYALDLPATLGGTTAFAGFTAATGTSYEVHDILAWRFVDAYAPIGEDRIFRDGFEHAMLAGAGAADW